MLVNPSCRPKPNGNPIISPSRDTPRHDLEKPLQPGDLLVGGFVESLGEIHPILRADHPEFRIEAHAAIDLSVKLWRWRKRVVLMNDIECGLRDFIGIVLRLSAGDVDE